MTSRIYNRGAAIRELLTLVDIATIDSDEECEICMDPFKAHTHEDREQVLPAARTPCQYGHTYGDACITAWLADHPTCPKCREVVLPFPPTSDKALESWRRARRGYLYQLSEDDSEAAVEASWFVDNHTSPNMHPSSETVYIVETFTRRPGLLLNQRYGAAKYYSQMRGRYGVMDHDFLAMCIRRDLGEERGRI